MRGGFYLGRRLATRNDPVRLVDPRPIANYGAHDIESGDAGLDGFTTLSRADPTYQGRAPAVSGVIGQSYQGPDESFEQ